MLSLRMLERQPKMDQNGVYTFYVSVEPYLNDMHFSFFWTSGKQNLDGHVSYLQSDFGQEITSKIGGVNHSQNGGLLLF